MDISILIDIFLMLLVGALLILLFTVAYRELVKLSKGTSVTPSEELVLQALEKWALLAVVAGERTARGTITNFDTELSDVDQVALATKIYALIPDNLTVGTLTLPIGLIKTIVPLSVFIAQTKNLFSEAHAFLLKNETYLTNEINTTPVATVRASIVAAVPSRNAVG